MLPTLKDIFNEGLCIRELLLRIGFKTEEISLGMSEDLKMIAMVLHAQGKEIGFSLHQNYKPWTKEELQVEWTKHVRSYVHDLSQEGLRNQFHEQVWLRSMAVENAEDIVLGLVKRGFRVPLMPATVQAALYPSQPWGIA